MYSIKSLQDTGHDRAGWTIRVGVRDECCEGLQFCHWCKPHTVSFADVRSGQRFAFCERVSGMIGSRSVPGSLWRSRRSWGASGAITGICAKLGRWGNLSLTLLSRKAVGGCSVHPVTSAKSCHTTRKPMKT